MYRVTFFSILIFWGMSLFAQEQPYFQQEVNYRIDVTLDDTLHLIKGNIDIEYINNAPEDLAAIYIHLWGNAYKNVKTAFAKQKVREGSTRFYFAKDSEFGYYDNLDFHVNGQKVNWQFDSEHPDIAKIDLASPLKNGEKVTISTPFSLKIPFSFSRLGHVGTSYQMTQWYPKPAVYDRDGWHPMPYLDMGEFYSEFGSFDVKITLPENYVVGATGVLQNEKEQQFLERKVAETKAFFEQTDVEMTTLKDTFPTSSSILKTIHYKAEKVHDFAWFADKRFHVQKSEVTLASGQKIDTWTMFTNAEADLWQKSIEYVDRSVQFYSEKVGEYPWPHATAVQSALSAGGGMEYPMITVIGLSNTGRDLDDVITHEVGHNWFYGILGFNERVYPWMDEGLNSFYEHRYMEQYYGDRLVMEVPDFLRKEGAVDLYELYYLFQAKRRLDQAPATHSNDFTSLNYGLGAYTKTAMSCAHLEQYLGVENFDAIMQSFYQEWQFKHPQPRDFRQHFEQKSGKDLSWFFDGYIESNEHLDYANRGMTNSSEGLKINVKNRGEIAAPFPISGMKNGEVVHTQWVEGFTGEQEIILPKGNYDKIIIDANYITLDINRENNTLKTSGLLNKVEAPVFTFLGNTHRPSNTRINWLPLVAWNKYDKLLAGLAFYNTTLPARKFEFLVAPMFGFDSKDLAGVGHLKYNIFPKSGALQKVTIGVSGKGFNFSFRDSLNIPEGVASTHLKYWRVVPSIKIDFRKTPTSHFYQSLQFRSIWLNTETTVFEAQDGGGAFYVGNAWNDTWIHELSYELDVRRAINPYGVKVVLEQQNFEVFGQSQHYLRGSLELHSAYTYDQGRSIDFRFFAGVFFQNTIRERGFAGSSAFNYAGQGFNDYRFDESYFGRTEQTGFWSQQIYLREGGMKTALGSAQSLGRSNDFLLAFNVKADLPKSLPLNLPVKPYFDMVYFNDRRSIASNAKFNEQLWWSGGFMLDFFDGIVGIYFPVTILSSKNDNGSVANPNGLQSLYKSQGKYWNQITFSIDFQRLNPWQAVNKLEL